MSKTVTIKAPRNLKYEHECVVASLANAEALYEVLRLALPEHPKNDYLRDAYDRAAALVCELYADLEDIEERIAWQ